MPASESFPDEPLEPKVIRDVTDIPDLTGATDYLTGAREIAETLEKGGRTVREPITIDVPDESYDQPATLIHAASEAVDLRSALDRCAIAELSYRGLETAYRELRAAVVAFMAADARYREANFATSADVEAAKTALTAAEDRLSALVTA